jgi:hypothetical protein
MQAAHEEKPKKEKEKETQSEIVGYLFCFVLLRRI